MRVSRRSGRLAAAVMLGGSLGLLVPSGAVGAPASGDKSGIESIERQIQELQDEVKKLKRANAGVEDLVDDKIRQSKPVAGYKNGFFVSNQAGDYKVVIRGYTQLDGRFFPGDSTSKNTDQFLFRRVRPILEGSLGKYVDFKIMPDFAAGNGVTLFDAYTDLKPFEFLKLRAGKFKPPVGLERLQSATDLAFVERALPTNLVPNRSLGLEIWGQPWNGALSYELGAFDFVPDLGNVNGNLNDDFTFAGRVFTQPFISSDIAPVKGLGAGIAGSYGSQIGNLSNSDLPTYKSAGQANIFSYVTGSTIDKQAIQNGNLTRFEPQAYWYWGPAGVLFEYNQSRTPVTLDQTSNTIANASWQVTGQWILTGEDNSFKGITVKDPFDPWNGKWGAFAVAARYGTLDIDRDAFRLKFADPTKSVQRAEEFALGTEWFWNRNIQIYLDYFQTHFYKGAGSGTYNRPTEYAVIGRIQLQL